MNKCVHGYIPAKNYRLPCPTGVLPTHTDCWGVWEPPVDPWGVDTSPCIISVTFSGFQCAPGTCGTSAANTSQDRPTCPTPQLVDWGHPSRCWSSSPAPGPPRGVREMLPKCLRRPPSGIFADFQKNGVNRMSVGVNRCHSVAKRTRFPSILSMGTVWC